MVAGDGIFGGLTAGLFHYGGKAVKGASPYVKKAFNKVSAKISENAKYARMALNNLKDRPKSVVLGSNFGNVSKKVDDFFDEFKSVKNAAKSQPKRMDTVIEVPEFKVKPKFKNNKKLNAEYTSQVEGQQNGLNKLTIQEYLDNRAAYKNRLSAQKQSGKKNPSGRDPKAATQQQLVRNEAIKEKIKEYTKQGLNRE